MDQLKVEFRQVERPLSLSSVKFLCISEVRQILVIRMNHSGVRRSLDIMMPFGESTNDGQQFSVIDFIVSFGSRECFGDEGTWMSISISV